MNQNDRQLNVKLYNVLFPIWMLVLFPLTWLIVLPGNFIIDFTVVALTMRFLKLPDIIKTTKAVILRVWLMGFVADFIGESNILDGKMLKDYYVEFSGNKFECLDKGFDKNELVEQDKHLRKLIDLAKRSSDCGEPVYCGGEE